VGEGDDALPAKSVRIAENRVAIGRQIEKGTPKSKASNRTLPMPDEVVELLKTARKRQLEERMAFGQRYGSSEYVAATLVHLRQVPIAVIAAWLGHTSAALTMSVYAHSQDDALKAAASSFGRVVTTHDTETGSEG
jgi:integrase